MSHNGQAVTLVGNRNHVIEGGKAIIVETEVIRTEQALKVLDREGRELEVTAANVAQMQRKAQEEGLRVIDSDGKYAHVMGIGLTDGKVTVTHNEYLHLGQQEVYTRRGHPCERVISTDVVSRDSVKASGYEQARKQATEQVKSSRRQELMDRYGLRIRPSVMTRFSITA